VHFSWDRLLGEARMLSQKSEIANSDQCWMLSEWIKYVADPTSQIIEPPQLGEHWNEIVRAARESNLPSVAKYVHDLAPAWDGYLRKECLRLRAKLGVEVEPRVPLNERRDPDARFKRVAQDVFTEGSLRGQVRVPDPASDLRSSSTSRRASCASALTSKHPKRAASRPASTGCSSSSRTTACRRI
jgi:hypothetical protein